LGGRFLGGRWGAVAWAWRGGGGVGEELGEGGFWEEGAECGVRSWVGGGVGLGGGRGREGKVLGGGDGVGGEGVWWRREREGGGEDAVS